MSEDKTIPCRECREEFAWTVGEQQFFAQMSYNPPVRCKPCRDKRKGSATPGAGRQERPVAVAQEPYRSRAPQEPRTDYRRAELEAQPVPDRRHRKQKERRRRYEEDDDYRW